MLNLPFLRTAPQINIPVPAAQTRARTLAQVSSGKMAKIAGFDTLAPIHRQHLQAYGLLPGRTVQVIAQKPVTIVLIEQTELAFESEIAGQVLVEEIR
jgi:Fe2+ transport system protein FeoA